MAGGLNNLPQLFPGYIQQKTLHLSKTRGAKRHNESQEAKSRTLEECPPFLGPSWDCPSRAIKSAVLA